MVEEHKKEEHHDHHEKKSSFNEFSGKIKKLDRWQKISIILAIILVVSIFTNGFNINLSSKNAIADKAVNYINSYLLKEGSTATLKSVEEISLPFSDFYQINLDIDGKEVPVLVTKDGKYIDMQGDLITLSKKPELSNLTSSSSQTQQQEIPKTNKPEVNLFIMSYCPYGIQAIDAMAPVAKLIKDVVKVNYVIYADYQGGGPDYCVENGKYCSMHGVQEVNEDVREMCIQKYQKDKFWDYMLAVEDTCTAQNVDSCWESVAKSVNVDTAKVKSCVDKEQVTLLKEQYELNQKNSVSGSPTLIINGIDYAGQRTADGYKTAICSAYNTEPSACSQELEVTGQTTTTTTGGCG